MGDLDRQLAVDERQAYVRALLKRFPGGWELHHAWALIGAEPPQWAEAAWEYERLGMVSCHIPAVDLTGLCSATAGNVVTFGRFDAVIPAAAGPANWTRRPSYARLEPVPLPLPVTDFRIAKAEPTHVHDQMLVAEGAPSFPEPMSAWRAFSEGNFSLAGAGQPPGDLALLRIVADEAWIGHVRVTATQVTAEIHGSAVAGAELELFGVSDRSHKRLDGPAEVTFSLRNGLPESAWLWLKRGSKWLDYRSIDARSGWTGDLRQSGVEIEQPTEPQANIEALIASGEGPQLEFKEQLPAGTRDRKMLKTVPAFATGSGGTILFGIN